MPVRCLGVFLTILPITLAAAPTVDAILQPLIGANTPGAAVLVRRDGRTIFERGYGVSDVRAPHAIGPATNFRLASFTKQFTAMAIMLLAHSGKLHYNQTLPEFFPDFPAYGRTITVRELLTHTAGLRDYEDLMGPEWSDAHQIKDQEVLDLLKHQSAGNFTPGTSWAYSNSAYVVLGLIVAQVSGEPFPQYLSERIFRPLHMTSTLVYVKGKNEVKNRAYGYSKNERGALVATDQSSTSATLGDGGVYSNLIDLAKWDDALRNHTLLSAAEMSVALTPVELADGSTPTAYGFGWFLDPYNGHARSWHSGTTCGFRTVIDRFSDDHLSIIILSNRTDIDPSALALQIADIYLNK